MTLSSAAGAELRRWGWRRTGGFARYAPLRLGGLLSAPAVQGGTGLAAWPGAVPSRRSGASRIRLGSKVQLARGVRLHFEADDARISIGDGTHLGPRTEVRCRERIDIGARCRISWDVQITDTDFHQLEGAVVTVPVVIGDDVWIGMRVTILKGVHVGSGAVVAAGSVVVADVPDGCLAAGVPAKVVRSEVRWSN